MSASPATVQALRARLGVPVGSSDAELAQAADVALAELARVTGRDELELELLPAGLEATLLAGARAWTRRDSPAGVSSGFETLPVYVNGTDPDYDALVVGLRTHWGLA